MKNLLHLGLILSLPLLLANSSLKTPSGKNSESEITKKGEKTSFLFAKKRTPANEALGTYPLNSTVCTSNNGAYQLVMQGDRNLVLYKVSGWKALWSSNTIAYSYIAYCDFRYNGELYLADVGANVWWQAGVGLSGMSDPSTGLPTFNPVTFKWILQDDGNFCRYVYDLSGNLLSVVSTGTQGGKVSSHRHTIS